VLSLYTEESSIHTIKVRRLVHGEEMDSLNADGGEMRTSAFEDINLKRI